MTPATAAVLCRGGNLKIRGKVCRAVIRTLVSWLATLLGAKLGANVTGHLSVAGYVQPKLSLAAAISSDARPCLATGRPCIACNVRRDREAGGAFTRFSWARADPPNLSGSGLLAAASRPARRLP